MTLFQLAVMDSSSLAPPYRVGYWFSERKSRKFDLEDFRNECARSGLDLIKVGFTAFIVHLSLFDLDFSFTTP